MVGIAIYVSIAYETKIKKWIEPKKCLVLMDDAMNKSLVAVHEYLKTPGCIQKQNVSDQFFFNVSTRMITTSFNNFGQFDHFRTSVQKHMDLILPRNLYWESNLHLEKKQLQKQDTIVRVSEKCFSNLESVLGCFEFKDCIDYCIYFPWKHILSKITSFEEMNKMIPKIGFHSSITMFLKTWATNVMHKTKKFPLFTINNEILSLPQVKNFIELKEIKAHYTKMFISDKLKKFIESNEKEANIDLRQSNVCGAVYAFIIEQKKFYYPKNDFCSQQTLIYMDLSKNFEDLKKQIASLSKNLLKLPYYEERIRKAIYDLPLNYYIRGCVFQCEIFNCDDELTLELDVNNEDINRYFFKNKELILNETQTNILMQKTSLNDVRLIEAKYLVRIKI